MRKSGQGHLSTQNGLSSRARHLQQKGYTKTLGDLKLKIQAGLTALRVKSKPPPDITLPEPQKTLGDYMQSLEDSLKRIDKAFTAAKQKKERDDKRDYKEHEIAKNNAKRANWNAAKVQLYVRCDPSPFSASLQ